MEYQRISYEMMIKVYQYPLAYLLSDLFLFLSTLFIKKNTLPTANDFFLVRENKIPYPSIHEPKTNHIHEPVRCPNQVEAHLLTQKSALSNKSTVNTPDCSSI